MIDDVLDMEAELNRYHEIMSEVRQGLSTILTNASTVNRNNIEDNCGEIYDIAENLLRKI